MITPSGLISSRPLVEKPEKQGVCGGVRLQWGGCSRERMLPKANTKQSLLAGSKWGAAPPQVIWAELGHFYDSVLLVHPKKPYQATAPHLLHYHISLAQYADSQQMQSRPDPKHQRNHMQLPFINFTLSGMSSEPLQVSLSSE